MPLPITHSAAGLATYFIFREKPSKRSHNRDLFLLGLLCLVCANLPDVDFVPGILIGEPAKFHPSLSHSILISIVMALIIFFLVNKKFEGISKKSIFGCCVISLLSHPILDYFTPISKKFSGYLLLWPFTVKPYISSFPLFRNVHRIDDSVYLFFTSLINVNNFWAIIVELLFSAILLSSVMIIARKSLQSETIWSFVVLLLSSVIYYFVQIKPALL